MTMARTPAHGLEVTNPSQLMLSEAGNDIDRQVTIESKGQFRLRFAASDNWGLDSWHDLVNDPLARTNLLEAEDNSNPTISEPGMFQQVFYGTVPDDPKLYTRAARHFFPNSPRSFNILEAQDKKIVVEATSSPMVNAVGVLSNLVCKVRYEIFPDGKILLESSLSAQNAQFISIWMCGIIGLRDPTSGMSILPPDTQGWIRSSATQNPYAYVGRKEAFIFAYWNAASTAFSEWTRASILLAPDPRNPLQGKQKTHNWPGFKRWGYVAENISLAAGQTITQNYMIQLGTQGSIILPDLSDRGSARKIARDYIDTTLR